MNPIMSNSPLEVISAIHTLRKNWGWVVALGVFFIVAGCIALGSVILSTVVTVYYIGFLMLVAGVFELVAAFQMKTWSRFFLWLLLAALYAVAGVLTISNPLLAASVLTLWLGAALIATGIMRIVVAFQLQEGAPWGWLAFSGVITILLGGVILFQWPVSSLYVLGVFLGVDLVFAGVSWTMFGLALREPV